MGSTLPVWVQRGSASPLVRKKTWVGGGGPKNSYAILHRSRRKIFPKMTTVSPDVLLKVAKLIIKICDMPATFGEILETLTT